MHRHFLEHAHLPLRQRAPHYISHHAEDAYVNPFINSVGFAAAACFCGVLQGWSAVKGLLQLRELFVGSGSPLSPGRFLFESVGQVHLIKWTPEGGSQVVPLNAAEIEQELSLLTPTNKQQPGSSGSNQQLAAAGAAAKAAEQQAQEGGGLAAAPAAAAAGAAGALMNSLRAWLDHHHRYAVVWGSFDGALLVIIRCSRLGWFCQTVCRVAVSLSGARDVHAQKWCRTSRHPRHVNP